MTEHSIADLDISTIRPSPYQHRRVFEAAALRELATSIERDGLIQPITVRPVNAHFELIAGERRWRAFQLAEIATIPARILNADDLQARRLCATENLQRADLTSLEEIMALCELVDASLLEFSEEYAPLAVIQEPKWRVRALLTVFESVRKIKARGDTPSDEMIELCSKFAAQVDTIFSGLPKPKDPISFTTHDLPLLFTDDEVQQFALDHRLNKAQTKAVDFLQQTAPALFQEIAHAAPHQGIAAILRMTDEPDVLAEDAEPEHLEEFRELSAKTIRNAAKEFVAEKHRTQSLFHGADPLPSIDLDALWLWGRLRNFQEMNLSRRPLSELMGLMTRTMREDTTVLVPKLVAYLTGDS